MKDQEKAAPRRRELVGRNEFPPFKRNQIRWALHCYRWKHGISWEKYPYEIAHALGMKGLGEGLNSRDPRGFVLEDQTPKPEKLRLYERFIQTAAPDYAKAFSEGGFVTTCGDFVWRYLNVDDLSIRDKQQMETENALEKMIYFYPFPGVDGFHYLTNFRTELVVFGFRRLGDTRYFQVFAFGIEISDIVRKANKERETGLSKEERKNLPRMTIELQEVIYRRVQQLPLDDNIRTMNLFTGIAVPHTDGRQYFSILRNKAFEPWFVQFMPCRFTKSETELLWRYTHNTSFSDVDFTDPYLLVSMVTNGTYSMERLRPDTGTLLMHGEHHESAQYLISKMAIL